MKHLTHKITIMMKTLTLASLLAAGVGVYGDDTEVFYSVNVSKPNLLFVLDVSGSMGKTITGGNVNSIWHPNLSIASGADDSYQNTSDWATDSNDNSIHLFKGKVARFRFTNINIPPGAQISEAYIQFTSTRRDTNHNNGLAQFKISADNSGDAPQNADYNTDPILTTEELWEPGNWYAGDNGSNQRAEEGVKELVKSIVDKDDWASGNAMAFYISSTEDGAQPRRDRMAASFENNNYAAPRLYIKYDDGVSRLDIMKESLRAVLDDAPNNVKVGLMNYGQESYSSNAQENKNHFAVSGVSFPVTDINAKVVDVIPTSDDLYGLPAYADNTVTVRQYIADIADGWNATSWTPIVDSLYEAALYMRGEKVHYGQTLPTKNGAHPSTYDNDDNPGNEVIPVNTDMEISGRDRSTTPIYKTPIDSSCQENYIVLMTDGAPTYNTSGDGLNSGNTPGPLARIGGSNPGPQGALADAIPSCGSPAGVGNAGTCGAELTEYIATHDNLPDASTSFPDGQDGEQLIKTFAIGFGTAGSTNTYLKSLATYDDGDADTDDDGFFPASSPEDLAAAFAGILEAVAAPKGTLASPGYSVNVKSGLEHEKDIYIPVFDRKNASRWAGNLKKFKIVEDNNKRKIRGSNTKDAVDELGGFTNQALDYWSTSPTTSPDGKVVQKGGLANLLDPATRNIVSDIVSNQLSANPLNELVTTNIAITNDVLGVPTTGNIVADIAYRNKIINFMRGWENGDATSSDKEKRFHMGDMLHSEPLVITYDSGTSAAATKKQYIFAGTNEGYLHAFDTSDEGANAGKEMFAFIPKELLGNLAEHQYLNAGNQGDHRYGVDGSLTYRFIDIDEDGVVDAGDQVILYFGLRRGGTSYYALDVTDIDAPTLLWKVTRSSDTANPLNRLGQSWSAPYLARVGVDDSTATCRISSTQTKTHCKEVMIVTGGYDDADDREDRTFCSDENDTCTLPANIETTVWYGANGTWVSKKNVSGSIACNNSTFGDPLVGTPKSCKYELNDGEYDSTSAVTATMGNDVFIFDANDGTLVWSLPASEKLKLTNSTPGGVRILDTNSNKLIDRMYFADTGGNIWRLDLSESISTNDTTSSLNKLADLSSSGNQARMFYNEPDVSTMKLNGKSKFLISLGSGFRAHPLDKAIEDKFFIIVDHSPYSPLDTDPTSSNKFSATTKAQLAKITVTADSVSQTGSIKDGKGWLVNLANDGEKVLATSVTVDGVVLFTTLVPEVLSTGVGIDQCQAPATQGRLYAIDILSGGVPKAPLAFIDDSDESTPGGGTGIEYGGGGTFSTISKGEIPGKPQAIFNTLEVNDNTGECTHPVDVRIGKKLSQATGYEACRLESVYWSDPETE